MFAPPPSAASQSIVNNQRSLSADINMVDVNNLSPVAERRVRNIVIETMGEVLDA